MRGARSRRRRDELLPAEGVGRVDDAKGVTVKEFFKTNEGAADRTLRIVAGIVLLSLTVVGPKTSWGFVGLLLLVTGLVGTCPLYSMFGLSTCPAKPAGPASR
jgi:hypothetical protein